MKTTLHTVAAVAAVSLATLLSNSAQAQTTVISSSPVTSMGTISQFSPETITVQSEGSTAPMAYRYSKTTTYVDETGAPVSMETVKSGLPVTVYYTGEGANMMASKVVVRRAATTTTVPVVPVESTTTRTTTTTTE